MGFLVSMMRTWWTRLLLMVLVAAAQATATGAATPGVASASTTQQSIFGDGAVNMLQDSGPMLDQLRALGVTTVRLWVPWSSVAPDPNSRRAPAHFDAADPAAYPKGTWAPYDTFVRDATSLGITVLMNPTGTAPLWATGVAPRGTATHNPATWVPSAPAFGQFVHALGTRYSGDWDPDTGRVDLTSPDDLPRVSFWSVWNEPNYGPNLTPQARPGGVEVSPLAYRSLLDRAWSALQATGHGHDTILFGELAPRGQPVPQVANGMYPLRFLRALYCVDADYRPLRGTAAALRGCPTTAAGSRRFAQQNPALFQASGYAAHPYTRGETGPPNVPSPKADPDWAGFADMGKLTRTLDRLTWVYRSRKHFPIYSTEFGFQTSPPKINCTCSSPTTAAYYMNWAEYLSWRNPRVRSYAQYQLADLPVSAEPRAGHYDFWASGLISPAGTQEPTYGAFRLPLYLPSTRTTSGRSLKVWGDVRPAPYAQQDSGEPQKVQIQFRFGSRGQWVTLKTVTVTNSRGYFEVPVLFPGSGSVRLQWSYPSAFADTTAVPARPVVSRTQRITIS